MINNCESLGQACHLAVCEGATCYYITYYDDGSDYCAAYFLESDKVDERGYYKEMAHYLFSLNSFKILHRLVASSHVKPEKVKSLDFYISRKSRAPR